MGFTSSLGAPRWAFNQVLHYDPREDMVDASAALVVGVGRYVFPVVEILGEGGKGQSSVVSGLVGVKTFAGATLLVFMWSAALPPANNPFTDEHIVYALVLVVLARVGAGKTLGLGAGWEKNPAGAAIWDSQVAPTERLVVSGSDGRSVRAGHQYDTRGRRVGVH